VADETLDQSVQTERASRRAEPGVLVVFAAGRATLDARTGEGAFGREGEIAVADPRMSRRHVEVRRERGVWQARDLGSRNGSAGDGTPLGDAFRAVRVVRAGDSVAILVDDVSRYLGAAVELRDSLVIGPTLRAGYDAIAAAARDGTGVHLTGETGSGKELAARHFHAAGPRATGPFVALNCAALPAQLAETLLFGARKGAYSGADADREGHLQAADGGTLFLDEIAELSLEVQAKLLRVLETREVVPLGATRARSIDVRIVSATHVDLRDAVAAGTFRDDLYFRLGRPAVALPPLRARPEEVPWLVAAVVGKLPAHVSLIEAALLRPWPGNVRELVTEVADAVRTARTAGATRVEASHLAEDAGQPLTRPAAAVTLDDEAVSAALAKHAGNVSAAARELGVHRTQLRRFLERRR
jgi:transcriptional regulator with PAS, ATPase and Fis domain